MLNRSRKNQNVSIPSDSVYESIAYDLVKTRLSESEWKKRKWKNQRIARSRSRTLSLVYSSVSARDSGTMQFSLDNK